MSSTLTMASVVISSVVILLTLGRIFRQSTDMTASLKGIGTKLLLDKARNDITLDKMSCKISNLSQQIRSMKGDVAWRG